MFFFFLLDSLPLVSFFFFNDTATTEIYTLSLHDALPISVVITKKGKPVAKLVPPDEPRKDVFGCMAGTIKILRDMESRSEEHTSELQSRLHLVCRLLLEKKKQEGTRTAIADQSQFAGSRH